MCRYVGVQCLCVRVCVCVWLAVMCVYCTMIVFACLCVLWWRGKEGVGNVWLHMHTHKICTKHTKGFGV